MLLATTCPGCGCRGPAPCGGCRAALRPAPALPPPPGVDGCRAVFAYEGAGRGLVVGLKYRNNRAALRWLATAMAGLAGGEPGPDVVTWVPTAGARRRARGFDQAELLARALARRTGLPCRRLLRRVDRLPQTGRSLPDRRRGPTFRLTRRPPASVLLVDDVVTTGATVGAAGRALRSGGAHRVLVVAAARTGRRPTPGAHASPA